MLTQAVVKAWETWYNGYRSQTALSRACAGRHKENPVIQRITQTDVYWLDEFEFSSDDIAGVYELILDSGKQQSDSDLVLAVIEKHCRSEELAIQAELTKGEAYQPKDQYEVGQQIVFPALELAVGTVAGKREGHNPEYGAFDVIQVEFDGQERVREFASGLGGDHKLNRREGEVDIWTSGDVRTPAELYERVGSAMQQKLVQSLQDHDEFVRVGDNWFLRELLVAVNPGQLNIAEALIEVRGMPLPTVELIPDLDMPAEVPAEVLALSLNIALATDQRFDNVGDSGRDIWYLNRLTPQDVTSPPQRLVIRPEAYERNALHSELLLVERQIDDEGREQDVEAPSRPIYRTTIALIYPHWRCGTLPLTANTRGMFPEPTAQHSPIILIDGQSGSRMQGWVVQDQRFVYGLKGWYARHKLPAGAIIKLERTRDPRVITVDFETRKLKRPWIRVAAVQDGELVFQMRKTPIACEFDEHLALGDADPRATDKLWAEVEASGESLLDVMLRVVPELVKLSPQATVHAMTIYSAVNVLRRTPPGPIFAHLATEPCFVTMGGGYWTFDEALA
jgi:hypothetical protein